MPFRYLIDFRSDLGESLLKGVLQAGNCLGLLLTFGPPVSEMKGNDPMNLTSVQMDQKEEETLSFDVSDEVLERAATTEMATPFTLGSCTGVSVCPSW